MVASLFLFEVNPTNIAFRINPSTTSDRIEPTLLDTNTGDKLEWIQIDCGGWHTAGLTKNGEVFTWGANSFGQLGHGELQIHDELEDGESDYREIPTKVESLDGIVIVKISCGGEHTAALTNKGEILTWYVRP
jgi:alpha-tubulin suppressor-like RCC1 family protein